MLNYLSFLNISQEQLKQPVILKKQNQLFYLLLNTKANTFSKQFVRNIHQKLDQVQANQGPTALITVSLSKVFSGGLDLKIMMNSSPPDKKYFVTQFISLLGRMTGLSVPTYCIVNGGAIAGGCMFAFAHDYIYGTQKAVFCTNEAQLQMNFPPGMLAVIRKRHPQPSILREMVLFSRKYNVNQALTYKFIDGQVKQQQIIESVSKQAKKNSRFGENKKIMSQIKSQLHKDVLQCCYNKQLSPSNIKYFRLQGPKL